ncbi:MAG: ArsC/Spx/MgsR family protein [Limnobacter sp.]|uniref:ArsC/Spx/MgsR family protein n=1 Tax=Limnobacter sp. TaxID=2003368 RepID=UPI00391D50DB
MSKTTGTADAQVFGIPNCDSVKKALVSLQSVGARIEFHDFKKQGVTSDLLAQWIEVFGAERVINRKGTTWRQLDDAAKAAADSPAGAIALALEKPSVIKRPVVFFQGQWTIGQTRFDGES